MTLNPSLESVIFSISLIQFLIMMNPHNQISEMKSQGRCWPFGCISLTAVVLQKCYNHLPYIKIMGNVVTIIKYYVQVMTVYVKIIFIFKKA